MQGFAVRKPAPMVSVVVPTAGRSPWLRQAVESVLGQSYTSCEVVVVDDSLDGLVGQGWNEECGWAHDERVRIIQSGGVGGGAARNAGVLSARGKWIAFLDDDDEWMPEKLEKQMEAVSRVSRRFVVMGSRVMVKTPGGEYVFPRRIYVGDESIAEYLFCRRGWSGGSGFLQTSTLVAERELLLRTPFAAGLAVHQDWDWLLRVSVEADVEVHMLDAPLAVYRTEDGRATVSGWKDWKASLDWIRRQQWRIEPRAISWFIAVQCVWKARASGASVAEWVEIARAFCFEGRPTVRAAAHFAVFAVIPAAWRKRIRDRAWGARPVWRTKMGGQTWTVASKPRLP